MNRGKKISKEKVNKVRLKKAFKVKFFIFSNKPFSIFLFLFLSSSLSLPAPSTGAGAGSGANHCSIFHMQLILFACSPLDPAR